jgi:hypothetical protein
MQSLLNIRGSFVDVRNFGAVFARAALAMVLFSVPAASHAQVQVFFSGKPADGTIEPINHPYYLTVQGTDQYEVNALGVADVTTGGYVYGWPEPGCGPGGIHTFQVINQANPPAPWYGFMWIAEMQGCDRPSVWFTTYSSAGLYPVQ